MRGFTLVEAVVSIGIFVMIMTGVFAVLNVGTWVFFDDSQRIDLQQQVRLAVDGMTREIRQSNRTSFTITGNASDFSFAIGNHTVRYFLDNGQIKRENPFDTYKVVANNVTSLVFSCRDAANANVSCGAAQVLQIQIVGGKSTRHGAMVYFPSTGGTMVNETVRFRN